MKEIEETNVKQEFPPNRSVSEDWDRKEKAYPREPETLPQRKFDGTTLLPQGKDDLIYGTQQLMETSLLVLQPMTPVEAENYFAYTGRHIRSNLIKKFKEEVFRGEEFEELRHNLLVDGVLSVDALKILASYQTTSKKIPVFDHEGRKVETLKNDFPVPFDQWRERMVAEYREWMNPEPEISQTQPFDPNSEDPIAAVLAMLPQQMMAGDVLQEGIALAQEFKPEHITSVNVLSLAGNIQRNTTNTIENMQAAKLAGAIAYVNNLVSSCNLLTDMAVNQMIFEASSKIDHAFKQLAALNDPNQIQQVKALLQILQQQQQQAQIQQQVPKSKGAGNGSGGS